ncbi:hypothetical protein EDB85DRAFT_2274722 [Lactarius pseudohatsudake]|nr:hypothetical protein EDB85DRAFT_2274722 [Lactarius pseudohatsudake]
MSFRSHIIVDARFSTWDILQVPSWTQIDFKTLVGPSIINSPTNIIYTTTEENSNLEFYPDEAVEANTFWYPDIPHKYKVRVPRRQMPGRTHAERPLRALAITLGQCGYLSGDFDQEYMLIIVSLISWKVGALRVPVHVGAIAPVRGRAPKVEQSRR